MIPLVEIKEERPKKSLYPGRSGTIKSLSSRLGTSGGILPKAILSLRRNSSFVENGLAITLPQSIKLITEQILCG